MVAGGGGHPLKRTSDKAILEGSSWLLCGECGFWVRWEVGGGGGGEGDLLGGQYSVKEREDCGLDQGFASEARKGLRGDCEGMDKMWEA